MANELKLKEAKTGGHFTIEIDKEKAIKKWDYDSSVQRVKPNIWKWGMMSAENKIEVWLAHEALTEKSQKYLNSLSNQTNVRSHQDFGDFCKDIGIEERTGFRWFKRCKYDKTTHTLIIQKDKESMAHVGHNSGENEWYTPQEIIDAVRLVMGEIDLDPASTKEANKIVGAKRFFTADDNVFKQEWRGRVFMNPPYSSKLIKPFCDKYASEVANGHIEQGIVLVNNATDTAWFLLVASVSNAICFYTGRIHFWSPAKDSATPLQGQAILYSGKNVESFIEQFKGFGHVWRKA